MHMALDFNPRTDDRFCLFSIKFSSDSKEILGGSNRGGIYVYDVPSQTRSLEVVRK